MTTNLRRRLAQLERDRAPMRAPAPFRFVTGCSGTSWPTPAATRPAATPAARPQTQPSQNPPKVEIVTPAFAEVFQPKRPAVPILRALVNPMSGRRESIADAFARARSPFANP